VIYDKNNLIKIIKNPLNGFAEAYPNESFFYFFEINLNNYGYHCDDFTSLEAHNNFLFSGCSVTSGLAIEQKNTWAYTLNQKMAGNKFFSLAAPGRSVDQIIDEIYQYIANFGKPKGIFLIFPSLLRDYFVFDIPDKNEYFATSKLVEAIDVEKSLKGKTIYEQFFYNTNKEETRLYLASRAIINLENYLEQLEIPFYWTTWEKRFRDFSNDSGLFKNYLGYNDFDLEDFYLNNYKPWKGFSKKTWSNALDGPKNRHPGARDHMFYLTLFEKAILNSPQKMFLVSAV